MNSAQRKKTYILCSKKRTAARWVHLVRLTMCFCGHMIPAGPALQKWPLRRGNDGRLLTRDSLAEEVFSLWNEAREMEGAASLTVQTVALHRVQMICGPRRAHPLKCTHSHAHTHARTHTNTPHKHTQI